jgi:ADP-L-glycero-D-manno-heptose 6-epimerase
MGRRAQIEYVAMPAKLKGKYQYHTQAEMGRFFRAAKRFSFTSLEDAVTDYVQRHLIPGKPW